ncbi:MAG TPA: DUF2894 domain-containing protein [Polyangiales bacterium]
MELAGVERALDALEARGARAFDAPSCDCVRTLITRAEKLEGKAAELLAQRAQVHVERLTQRFDRARSDTEQLLAAAEARHGAQATLRAAYERGELGNVRRALRKLGSMPPRPLRIARSSGANDYESSLAELVAAFALARAVDVVPQDAGPYNPLRIASDLLERMRDVSPIYLTAQLNRLEELASMMALPELPEPASKTLPRKRRGSLKSGS